MSEDTTHDAAATPGEPTHPHVHVQLTGRDGNAFAIIAAVAKALRREVGKDAATAFTAAAFACGSYDELLHLAMTTVQVH